MFAPFLLSAIGVSTSTLQVWAVDPLVKVFKDDLPVAAPIEPIEVARGEQAEWQIVVRSDVALSDLKVTVGPLRAKDGQSLGRPKVQAIGYVTVDQSMAEPAKDLLRKAPAEYPDPLMLDWPSTLDASTSQPFWIDVAVPAGAVAGDYEAPVTVRSGSAVAKLPINLRVRNVTVGKSRLWVTNWFFTGTGHMPGSNKPGSKEEEAYLAVLGKSMAAHRQNVAMVSPLSLAKFRWDAQGRLAVDFARFDTWVRILSKAGVIGRLEGGHFGGRVNGDWTAPFGINIVTVDGSTKMVAPDSPEADKFYSQFLPQLVAHLKRKGWWNGYVQHIADEPIHENVATYRQMSALVRRYAPGMRVIEATHTKELDGAIDVWVPQLNYAHVGYDFYKDRQKKGEEFWTYTCVWPEGEYANRFIELPLIKTRLLHWINFRYGITGYLHWGFNYWVPDDPFQDVTRTKAKDGWGGFLPAGDSWIVYPKDGKLLDSIRFETMRDGIADYELLSMLAEKDPAAADRLARKLVLAFDRYDTDVNTFRAVRRDLLARLAP